MKAAYLLAKEWKSIKLVILALIIVFSVWIKTLIFY